MYDRETTPAQGTPMTLLEQPAVERNGNGHDARVDPSDARDEELTRRALDAIPAGQSPAQYARMSAVFSFKSAEHAAASYEAAGGALRESRSTREYVQRLVENRDLAAAAVPPIPPPRPPLPSLVEVDLEVIDRTHDGTPVYKASAPQMQAVRETERRHAFVDFAAGEEQRTNERIRVAVQNALAQQALEKDAGTTRAVRGAVRDNAILVSRTAIGAGLLAIGAALWTAIKTLWASRPH